MADLSTGMDRQKDESEESVSESFEELDSALVHRFGLLKLPFVWLAEHSRLH